MVRPESSQLPGFSGVPGAPTSDLLCDTSDQCRPPLVVSCRRHGLGLQIGMRPRARHRKLYQVLGGHMTIGFANKSNTPVRVHTTFAFR